MKKILKLTALLLVLLIIIPLGAGCGDELKVIRVSEATHSVFYAPMYVAMSEGFFEEQGLKIRLNDRQGSDKVMEALLARQCEIGFAGPETCIYAYNNNTANYPKVFAQVTQKAGTFLVGPLGSWDFKWSLLKGKTVIGGPKGSLPEMTLRYVLKKNGIIPDTDVKIDTMTAFADMAAAFRSGQGEFVTLFEPLATAIEKEKTGEIAASIGQELGMVVDTACFTRQDYITKNGDIVQKFTNALYKGQLWVDSHSAQEIAKSIQSLFPDVDEQTLTGIIQTYSDKHVWRRNPIVSEDAFAFLLDIMKDAGQLEKIAEFNTIVDNRFAQKAVDTNK